MGSKFRSQFVKCREVTEHEVTRPKYMGGRRSNPIIPGQLEYLVQPIYDYYAVAVATVATKQQLFAIPEGQQYTPAGGTQITKTLYHTNLVIAGNLDAPKKFLVKNVAVIVRGDAAPQDLVAFIGQTLLTLTISAKVYLQELVAKTPAGAGPFSNAITTQTAVAGGTMANVSANGWPDGRNTNPITDDMPQVPGLDPMPPILGQLIEQNQPFTVILDPTITGSPAFTTLAAAPTTQMVGTGINAHVYLEGILMRAIL
jgi:hypothetical protein